MTTTSTSSPGTLPATSHDGPRLPTVAALIADAEKAGRRAWVMCVFDQRYAPRNHRRPR